MKNIIIRQATHSDLLAINEYTREIFQDLSFSDFSADEISFDLEMQKNWLKNLSFQKNSLLLVAEIENEKIIGMLEFNSGKKQKTQHVGELGISVHPSFQRMKVGTQLIQNFKNWVEHNRFTEKVFLKVFANNTIAINFYRKHNFEKECIHTKAIKNEDGIYVDIIEMCYFKNEFKSS
jgi:ribosomal protein S18 acetylase RimI-like enzyme